MSGLEEKGWKLLEDLYPANVRGGGVKRFDREIYERVKPVLAERMAQYILTYGECVGQTLPTAEDCSTMDSIAAHDENCDGAPDCSGAHEANRLACVDTFDGCDLVRPLDDQIGDGI